MLTETKKKSEMVANTGFHLEKLVIRNSFFIPCTYAEALEEITFTYDMDGLHPLEEIKKEDKKNQYQLLINLSGLRQVMEGYRISFTSENLYYDDNYLPHIKERDLYRAGEEFSEEKFLADYKTFVGGVLGRKYAIRELQDSGLEVLKQEPGFKAYYEAADVDALVKVLQEKKKAYIVRENATTVRVDKKGYRIKSILAVVTPILLLLALGGFLYCHSYVIPRQQKVISANEAFIQTDYVGCIDYLDGIQPGDMSVSTMYILAVSYAKTESLKKEEIEGIVSKLSVLSNQKELEYWINLGRGKYAAAEELAQALSDDQLLVYAYMKELNQLESDTSMNGEEKQQRIETLQDKIVSLGEKYKPEEE